MTARPVDREVLTFLFTDLVGSTELWEQRPDEMGAALARHHALVVEGVDRHGGSVFKNTGDGAIAVFRSPGDAVLAAVEIVRVVRTRDVEEGGLDVRVGLNTGPAEVRGGDYFGSGVNLAARVVAVAHTSQILVTAATAGAVIDGVTYRDLGEHWLKGFRDRQHLFQVVHPDLPATFPPLLHAAGVGVLPPLAASTFVDRVDEIAALHAALHEHRLVTLVGPGGVGKSRLAQEVGRELAPSVADGVWWCELAPVVDAAHIAHAVAATLDVSVGNDDVDVAIVGHLASRRALLLLDNCEHVVGAVRDLVDTVLRRCPGVSVLATSREALRITGEQVHVVDPLACGTDAVGVDPAVALFLDRVRAVGGVVDDGPEGLAALQRLCARLDGLPLAIELAAARARTMTVHELERGLAERFDLLATRTPTGGGPDRHRTMRQAVRWSYELLADDERELFELLGVFRGGFQLDAARHVARRTGVTVDDTADVLYELVEKSLVRTDTAGVRTRFVLLETLREFAAERLEARGRAEEARRAHAEHFRDVAETAERRRAGREERRWIEVQYAEFDNFRAAMANAVAEDDLDTALRLYLALYELASFQGRVEVFEWFDPASHVSCGHELLPAALAMSALRQDPTNPVSIDTAVAAIDLLGRHGGRDHRILSFARGFAEASRGNRTSAIDAYRRSAEVILETEGPNGRWVNARALVLMATRDAADAQQLLIDARRIGQPTGVAFALLASARSIAAEHPDRALDLIAQAREQAASVDNRHAQVYVDLTAAAIVARGAGPRAALDYLVRALVDAVELGQHEAIFRALGGMVGVLRRADLGDAADELLRPWEATFPDSLRSGDRLAATTRATDGRGLVDLGPPRPLDQLVEHTRRVVEDAPVT